MHRAARQLLLLLTMFAWLTADIHSSVAHCLCAEACHEASSGPTKSHENISTRTLSASEYSFRALASSSLNVACHEITLAHPNQDHERGCCDTPDSNVCLDPTQEMVTAPVIYGSNSSLLSQLLAQFSYDQLWMFQALVCATIQDPAHTQSSARTPSAEDTRTVGWLRTAHTALPVRGPSIPA